MSTFREVMRAAERYNKRFAHVPTRSASADLFGIFGVPEGRARTVADLDATSYDQFIYLCDLYAEDWDDGAVYLVK